MTYFERWNCSFRLINAKAPAHETLNLVKSLMFKEFYLQITSNFQMLVMRRKIIKLSATKDWAETGSNNLKILNLELCFCLQSFFNFSLLLVSTLLCFTVFTTPKTVINVITSFNWLRDGVWSGDDTFRIITAVCNVFFNINYSCNFYFYCFANREIQTAFINLVKQCKEYVIDKFSKIVSNLWEILCGTV